MENMTMGSRIAARRKALGLTLGDLSRLCGIAPGTIGDLEHGRQLSSGRLHHLARALAVNVEWLETGEGPMAPQSDGVRPAPSAPTLSPEARRVAEQWEKLDEPAKSQTRAMIDSFVAVQQREERRRRSTPPHPRTKVPAH